MADSLVQHGADAKVISGTCVTDGNEVCFYDRTMIDGEVIVVDVIMIGSDGGNTSFWAANRRWLLNGTGGGINANAVGAYSLAGSPNVDEVLVGQNFKLRASSSVGDTMTWKYVIREFRLIPPP